MRRDVRADLVMLVGFAIIVYAAIIKEWGVITFGVILLLVGFLVPRMSGPFSLRAPNLEFKGELVDPADSARRPPDRRSAQRELPPPPAPPT